MNFSFLFDLSLLSLEDAHFFFFFLFPSCLFSFSFQKGQLGCDPDGQMGKQVNLPYRISDLDTKHVRRDFFFFFFFFLFWFCFFFVNIFFFFFFCSSKGHRQMMILSLHHCCQQRVRCH